MFHWLPKLEDCLSLIVGQHLKWLLKCVCVTRNQKLVWKNSEEMCMNKVHSQRNRVCACILETLFDTSHFQYAIEYINKRFSQPAASDFLNSILLSCKMVYYF